MNVILRCLILVMISASSVFAQTLPSGFSLTRIAYPIKGPTTMAVAPDGRIFICRQAGEIRVVKNDVLLATAAIKINVDSAKERGLIGIALDPNFASNNYVYLYHTRPTTVSPRYNRISRYTFTGDIIDPLSQQTILDLDPLPNTNHNGGAMAFGPDGKLYVAVGNNNDDGGDPSFVGPNSQDLNTYHGKLLRINSNDGSAPADNPFNSGSPSAQKARIWCYGLRNPYSIDVHPTTGKILVNDVGNKAFEEINDATTGGQNFGWPIHEGTAVDPLYVNPIFTYQNVSLSPSAGDGKGCAITGGTFFNPSATNYPATYMNKYFYLDWCNGWINYIDHTLASPVANAFALNMPVTPGTPYIYPSNPARNVILRVGTDGTLYYLNGAQYDGNFTTGALYKIEHTAPVSGIMNKAMSVNELSIYPLPAKENLNVKWTSEFSGEGMLTISNALGKELMSLSVTFFAGENVVNVDVNQLKGGIYFLELKSEGMMVKIQKVVIGE